MGQTLRIKTSIADAQAAFNNCPEATFTIRLDKKKTARLHDIVVAIVTSSCYLEQEQLESIILKEIAQLLRIKYHKINVKASVVLSCSQARTLLLWLNDYNFEHPLDTNLACELVDSIYKQLI